MQKARVIFNFGMGFTQSGHAHNGVTSLWLNTRKYASKDVTVLTPFQWKTDPVHVAGLIRSISDENTKIISFNYSWGCGQFMIRLGSELAKFGLWYEHLFTCDGVARTRWVPTWLPANPLSLANWRRLKVPWNTHNLYGAYQRNNKPSGHKYRVTNPDTKVHTWIQAPKRITHTLMDDWKPFHDKFLEVAKKEVEA